MSASKTKAWIQAFRLRTLPLAFSSILLGAFLASASDYFNGVILGLSLLTTLFLQVLSNLANDYGDARSGVDGDEREGPSRTVQTGLISQAEMKSALFICAGLALISGVALIIYSLPDQWGYTLTFLVMGFGAIAAAIKYTVGKNPYGYAGFGDLFVLIFFGYVGVLGTYFLYAQSISMDLLLPATTCGLFSVAVLNVNNIRDIESDRKTGKYSIPVRLGRSKAVVYHWFLLLSGLLTSVVYGVLHEFQWSGWLFLLVTPLVFINARAVYTKKTSQELDPFLKQMALTTLLYVVLFGWALL
ncbi:1,4-dihydroxy-2-naphthoate polyprenyltransferase [Marinoscillum sp. MHG1-6]|uniref:1,4-dihydroxy-2-naphthoate polyprenyltransferase n=1 Tax=Marinoscillum sp. MHG1-6 TaxID=2959627 RepID=UPI0021576D97|nr:1,4-dihydroxy-2-naphthoate polyprenyltransferase [Marinoscillum sp. MHG1-6]